MAAGTAAHLDTGGLGLYCKAPYTENGQRDYNDYCKDINAVMNIMVVGKTWK